MTISIKEDLLEGAEAVFTTRLNNLTRVFKVDGLAEVAGYDQFVSAATATDNTPSSPNYGFTMPVLNSIYPDVRILAYLDEIKVRAAGMGVFFVTCTYRLDIVPSGSSFYEGFETSFKTAQVNYDINGNPTNVTYTPTVGSPASNTQAVNVTKEFVVGTFFKQIFETTNEESLATTYTGYVNSATWNGYAARTVCFLGIQGSSKNGVQWSNKYTFAYCSITWDEFVAYTNVDGSVPIDISAVNFSNSSGNGWGRFQTKQSVDFNSIFTML
jgi:hypothetical protein